jgi:hypothetical protein
MIFVHQNVSRRQVKVEHVSIMKHPHGTGDVLREEEKLVSTVRRKCEWSPNRGYVGEITITQFSAPIPQKIFK